MRADIEQILASWSRIDRKEARHLAKLPLYPKLESLAGNEELVWFQSFSATRNPDAMNVSNVQGGLLAVTDTRLLFVSNDGSGQWPLRTLNSVRVGHTAALKVLTFAGEAGEVHFFAAARDIIEPLVDFVESAIHNAATEQQPAAVRSDADELGKFVALRDSGIISDAEFERKKAQILGF